VVENVKLGSPAGFSLKILSGERLRKLLGRAKEQRYSAVPWPVADYDAPERHHQPREPGDLGPS